MLRHCCRSRALAALHPPATQAQPVGRNLALLQKQTCIGRPLHCFQARYSTEISAEDAYAKAKAQAKADLKTNLRNKHLSNEFKECFNDPKTTASEDWSKCGNQIVISGHMGRTRSVGRHITFTNVERDGKVIGQICAKGNNAKVLAKMRPYSAVLAKGVVTEGSSTTRFEMEMESIQYLNPFPRDIIMSRDMVFPPEQRHLQLRFHQSLRERLQLRAHLKSTMGQAMMTRGFMDVETPLLFKSTSEGAREFIVPTRRPKHSYALPQSPQQYKQVLMASGMPGYYQFARCFRDEDHRADRQPEFTQLDMEKSFATGKDVMEDIEYVVSRAWESIREQYVMAIEDNSFAPVRKASLEDWEQSVRDSEKADAKEPIYQEYPEMPTQFTQIPYQQCMDLYGSDKPDLRIPNRICRVEEQLTESFVSMITDLKSPIVEVWKISPREGADRGEVWKFVTEFMENLPKTLSKNPDGAPTALMFDSSKPLNGFSALGPGGLDSILDYLPEDSGFSTMENGDIVLFQARVDRRAHQGGSTKLGETRIALYNAALKAGLVDRSYDFKFLWVTDFPLFTPVEEGDVGQGGASGFAATHHPFTAPHSPEDFEHLFTNPLRAKADHYDLVLNGVELGGGSRRIHIAEIQEFIFRDILQMQEKNIMEFSHLLKALRAGCPPHAGFAIGFDRFVAVLSGASSVRDVIAFPKNNRAEDEFAGGPTKISKEQLDTYHLRFLSKKESAGVV